MRRLLTVNSFQRSTTTIFGGTTNVKSFHTSQFYAMKKSQSKKKITHNMKSKSSRMNSTTTTTTTQTTSMTATTNSNFSLMDFGEEDGDFSPMDEREDKMNFIKQAALSDKRFASIAQKSIEDMNPKERNVLKHQLQQKFIQSFRDKLTKDMPEEAAKVSDHEILDFVRSVTQGIFKRVRLPDKKDASSPQKTNLKKEVSQMTVQEKNSVYTFILYRIMLRLLRGKKLDRGETKVIDVDAPIMSKEEQEVLRKDIKAQFLANAGITDQNQIHQCFSRAEHAIYRFNAILLGNISLPARNRSDLEKYQAIEDKEPDSRVEAYWNAYYQQEGSLDEWYCSYEPLKPFFEKVLADNQQPFQNALVVGCGMSSLGAELLSTDFAQIVTQVDISEFAVLHMKDVYKSILKRQKQLQQQLSPEEVAKLKTLEFKHADVRDMSDEFPDDAFDVVVDKACLDSILTTSETGEEDIPEMETEVWRVLKPDTGVWLLVTVLDSDGIDNMLVNCPWRVECVGSHEFIPNTNVYVYKLTKLRELEVVNDQ